MNRVNSILLAALLTVGLSSMAHANSRFGAGVKKADASSTATLRARSTRMLDEAHGMRFSAPNRASTLASQAVSHSDEAYAHKLELPAHVSQTMKDRAVRIIETAQNENEVRRLEHEASTGELRRLQYDTMGHERVDAIVRRLSSAPFGMEAIQRPRFQAAAIEVIVDSNVQQIATAKAWLATVRDPKFVKQDHWPLTNATNSIKHLVNSAAYRTPFEGQLRKNHPRMFAALQAQRKEMIELENQIRTEMTLRDIR